MKQSAMPVGLQWSLPLNDAPHLAIPRQQELALALMDLLIEVGRQVTTSEQEDHCGTQTEF